MLVASRISPAIKKQLQAHNVAYLEANGNFYLKESNKMFWIDAHEPLKIENDSRNRAFTKTDLKVLIEFLQNPTLINQFYRQIAEQTGTSIIINSENKPKYRTLFTAHTIQIMV